MSPQLANFQTGQSLCPVTPTFIFRERKLERILLNTKEHNPPADGFHVTGQTPNLSPLRQWFSAYCQRIEEPFPYPIDLGQKSFMHEVLKAMLEIRFSEVMTYGELAQALGKPGAARAVGNACNKNPYPLVIPCHRVIRAGGKIGGFALGCEMKYQLLTFEGQAF